MRGPTSSFTKQFKTRGQCPAVAAHTWDSNNKWKHLILAQMACWTAAQKTNTIFIVCLVGCFLGLRLWRASNTTLQQSPHPAIFCSDCLGKVRVKSVYLSSIWVPSNCEVFLHISQIKLNKTLGQTRDFSRQIFPQKFWVKSESTPLFLSENLSLEHKSRQILIHNKNTRLEQTLNFPENAYTFN